MVRALATESSNGTGPGPWRAGPSSARPARLGCCQCLHLIPSAKFPLLLQMNGFHPKITGLIITLRVQENFSLCHCHFLYLVHFSEDNNETTSQSHQAEILNLAGAVSPPGPCESPLLPGARPAAAMDSGHPSARPRTWRHPCPSAVSSRQSRCPAKRCRKAAGGGLGSEAGAPCGFPGAAEAVAASRG